MATGTAIEVTGPQAINWGPGDYAIVYGRVSDEVQTTIPEQISMGTAAAARLGLPVPDDAVYTDKGKSRDLFESRPGIQAALHRATDPHAKALIVWIPSRLFGDPEHSIIGFRHLARHGVRLFDIDLKEVDVSSSVGQLMGMIQGWQDKSEVDGLRKKVGDTHRVKANGGRMISRPPYGVKVVPVGTLSCTGVCRDGGRGCEVPHGEISKKGTVWIWDEEQCRVLLMMYGWAAAGVSTYQIAVRLAGQGIRTPVRQIKRGKNVGSVIGGQPWEQRVIREILLNRFYRGEFTWNIRRVVRDMEQRKLVPQPASEWIVKPHALGPLVDPEVWDKTEAHILRRRKVHEENRKYDVRLFDGFVDCGRCGWKFYPSLRTSKRSAPNVFDYLCGGRVSRYSSCARSHQIPEGWLYKALEGELSGISAEVQGEKVKFETASAGVATGLELKAIQSQLRDLEDQLANLKKLALKGFFSEDEAVQQRAELEATKAQALQRQTELLGTPEDAAVTDYAPDAVLRLMPLLRDERLPLHERRASLGNVIDRIIVDRGNSPEVRIVLCSQEALQA
jgi:DNA invertase Pin-like site-specific DNA recombinase